MSSHPRTRVAMLAADYLWRGWSAEEIVRHYPYLTLAEVHAALGYYFDHREEIDAELLEESREADAWRKSHPTASELVSFGEMIADLELIAKATEPAFWRNRVEQLPL